MICVCREGELRGANVLLFLPAMVASGDLENSSSSSVRGEELPPLVGGSTQDIARKEGANEMRFFLVAGEASDVRDE